MKRFLIIGIDPDTTDFSGANTPPGLTAEKLTADIEETRRRFAAQGDQADVCAVTIDMTAGGKVSDQLASSAYDCIMIGGGLRQDPAIEVLERIMNAVHRHAPAAAIAFLKLPQDGIAAAARVLSREFAQAGLIAQQFSSADAAISDGAVHAAATHADRVGRVLSLMKAGDDAFNRQDIAAMDAAHHPEIIAHMTGSEKPTVGRAALATALKGMFRAFPDVHVHNDPYPIQFGEGDWMTVITKATGTFTGEMVLPDGKTVPGTGKSFDVAFSTTAKWEGDLLAEEYVSWDATLMAQQIGIA